MSQFTQGGYPPQQQGGYPPQQGGYPPQQGGQSFAGPPMNGTPPQQGGRGMAPPHQQQGGRGMAPQQGGMVPQQGGMVPPQQQQGGRGMAPPQQQQGAAALTGASSSSAAASTVISAQEKKLPSTDDVIHLNVGGVKFSTTKTTLRKYPNTLTAQMFSEENLKSAKPDKNGAYFVDRNGDAFESVLEFLRTGKLLHQSKKVSAAVIKEELRFWRITPTLGEFIDPAPQATLADRIRRQTLDAMYREGRIYIDIFMRLLSQELETASSYGKSQVYLLMGDPSSANKTTRTRTSVIKGKHMHDTNLHKWLTLRRGHLTLLRQAVEREGLKLTINTGLPNHDWIQFIVSWPLDANELKGSFDWE